MQPGFKVKVALVAVNGGKTRLKSVERFQLHLKQIIERKQKLVTGKQPMRSGRV